MMVAVADPSGPIAPGGTLEIVARRGLHRRLLAAFIGLSLLVVIAAGIASFSLWLNQQSHDRISSQSIPVATVSLDLTRRAQRIVDAVPQLVAATTRDAQAALTTELEADVAELNTLLEQIRQYEIDPRAAASIDRAAAQFAHNISAINRVVGARIAMADTFAAQIAACQEAVSGGLGIIEPLVSDEQTGLGKVLLSDPVVAGQRLRLIDATSAAQELRLLLSIFADLDPNLATLRAGHALRLLAAAEEDAPPADPGDYRRFLASLSGILTGSNNLGEILTCEAQLQAAADQALDKNADHAGRFADAVDRLINVAQADVASVNASADSVQKTAFTLLSSVVVATLLSSFLIVRYYVQRNILARLPVIVTLETGGDQFQAAAMSMSLIAMAIGTFLQSLRYGLVVAGFFGPCACSGIYLAPMLQATRTGGLGLAFGMIVFSGIVSLGSSRVLRRYRWLFPPEVSGVVVLMVGLSLVPIALPRFVGLSEGDTVSAPAEWSVALVMLGAIMVCTVLPLGRIRLYSTAIGFTLGYGLAAWLGLFDTATFETVRNLPMLGLHSVELHRLSFDVALVLPFLAATIASNISDGGLIISSQKTNDANWSRPDTRSLSGGIVATGLSNISAGLLGGTANNLSGGNISLASATGSTSRRIGVYLAAIFVLMAFMPKLMAMLALVPAPVLGAGLLYLASHLVSSGISLIASRMLDARRNFVVGLPLLAGIGMIALPGLFVDAPNWVGIVASSPLALATLLALALNIVLNARVANQPRPG